MLPNARRVQQHNWNAPERTAWLATLDAAIEKSEKPVILICHSLGCALAAWWAMERHGANHARKVQGALLVAPPDVERHDFPEFVTGFSPMPQQPLPFRAIVAASSNDPWCTLSKAQAWAGAWGATFHDIGPRGHINADSGLDDWPQGRAWVEQLKGCLS